MMLKTTHVQADAGQLSASGKSMYEMLEQQLKATPVNLTGCTSEQVLYYVSQKAPVIAMKNRTDAVLIIGYDELNLTYFDPSTRSTQKIGRKTAETMFSEAGNVFISYVK